MSLDNQKRARIILAADGLPLEKVLELVGKIGSRLYAIKVHHLYDEYGPSIIPQIRAAADPEGIPLIWVDFKLHDIPATVEKRAAALVEAGAEIITVHASGGREMMEAAIKGVAGRAKVFAVTLLTSLKPEEIENTYNCLPREEVIYLAKQAAKAGVNGVVASAEELQELVEEQEQGPELRTMDLIIPGIRLAGKLVHQDDQQRIGTPGYVIKTGGLARTALVIGRPIAQAPDPEQALDEIETDIALALQEKGDGS